MNLAGLPTVVLIAGAALFALVIAVAFAAYLRPEMLISAWNAMVLCF